MTVATVIDVGYLFSILTDLLFSLKLSTYIDVLSCVKNWEGLKEPLSLSTTTSRITTRVTNWDELMATRNPVERKLTHLRLDRSVEIYHGFTSSFFKYIP